MSTSYHYLKEPITDLRVAVDGDTATLTVYVNGGVEPAGTLTIPADEAPRFALMFADDDGDDSKAPVRTYWGGAGSGCVVNEQVRGLDPALPLVSEYGEVKTVREIRAFDEMGSKP